MKYIILVGLLFLHQLSAAETGLEAQALVKKYIENMLLGKQSSADQDRATFRLVVKGYEIKSAKNQNSQTVVAVTFQVIGKQIFDEKSRLWITEKLPSPVESKVTYTLQRKGQWVIRKIAPEGQYVRSMNIAQSPTGH